MTAPTGAAVGVDLGSGSARVVALDDRGTVLGGATAAYPGSAAWAPGHADPEAWLVALDRALAELARAVPAAARPGALAVGGVSPATIVPGHATALTVQHPAGATGTNDEQQLAQLELLRRQHGDAVRGLQLWDWVLHRLGAPPACGRWPGDPDLPGFGTRVDTGTVVGHADGSRPPLPAGTPLVPGAQDAYLSFWAGGLDVAGRGLDPGGRTGGLGVAVTAGARPAGMYALPSAARGVDVVGGPTAAHGLVLDWWSGMTGRDVPDLLAAAEAVPPGSGGVLALPYLEGERAPRWNRDLRAELVGLSSTAGPAEVMRALLEGTAYGLAHIARDLQAQGVGIDVVVTGGSPGRSPLWTGIKAAVLGIPIEVPEHPELSAYGAALAAGTALGWWPSPGAGAPGDWPRPAVARLVEPEPRPEYEAGYARFVALGDAAVARLSNPNPGATP